MLQCPIPVLPSGYLDSNLLPMVSFRLRELRRDTLGTRFRDFLTGLMHAFNFKFTHIFSSRSGEPLIKISSTPSSNELRVGASIKLTCTAWQTDELTMRSPEKRPYTIYWYDPQDKRVGERCQAGLPAAKEMSCSLMVGPLTKKQFGFYTCKAINGDKECSNKRFEINLEGKQIKTVYF